MAVKVLIVDDQPAFRVAAREVIAATEGFEVVGEAESGEESVVAARRLHPDLVLMDVQMPGVDGMEASRRIRSEQFHVVVFLLYLRARGLRVAHRFVRCEGVHPKGCFRSRETVRVMESGPWTGLVLAAQQEVMLADP